MQTNSKKHNLWVYLGAMISIFLIIYCLVYIVNYYSANNILWHYPKNYKQNTQQKLAPNEIGDTIAGVLTPIIGLVAALLTFLAFYMQKRANDQIQSQFHVQQFESQFYEMLRLHKGNVDDLEITSIRGHEIIHGRKVFESMAEDFTLLLSYIPFGGSIQLHEYESVYNIFFWGYSETEANKLSEITRSLINGQDVTSRQILPDLKTHRGYSSSLGHYFRHLFMMVKYIANNKIITDYDNKMNYLKIIRAQLSNHEQIIIFYNWLSSEYGGVWEDDKNHFFTEYKMIHNLWNGELYQDDFIINAVNGLIDKYNKAPKETPLFEFQGNDFSLKMQKKEKIPLADLF